MATPIDIAYYLIYLADNEEEPEFMSHMRLQKLLYYIQGWSLATRGDPIFEGEIEACKHGPVVRTVYPTFASYSKQKQMIPFSKGADPDSISQEDKDLIRSVWDYYKQFSASQLREMTHMEAPWKEAYIDSESPIEISQKTMLDFFRSLYESEHTRGFELDVLRQADQEFKKGNGIPLDEVLNNLGYSI